MLEEQILSEDLDSVLVRPLAFGDKQALNALLLEPTINIILSVNAKGQVIRIKNVLKGGKTVQMHQVINFDIDTLPQAT